MQGCCGEGIITPPTTLMSLSLSPPAPRRDAGAGRAHRAIRHEVPERQPHVACGLPGHRAEGRAGGWDQGRGTETRIRRLGPGSGCWDQALEHSLTGQAGTPWRPSQAPACPLGSLASVERGQRGQDTSVPPWPAAGSPCPWCHQLHVPCRSWLMRIWTRWSSCAPAPASPIRWRLCCPD